MATIKKVTAPKAVKWADKTPREKRIAIAKDVITQLHAGKILTGSYGYCSLLEGQLQEGKQLRPQLKKVVCGACAKGALFLTHVKIFNAIEVDRDNHIPYSSDDLYKRFKGIFTSLQLDMIETAFERTVINDRTGKLSYEDLGNKCIQFGRMYDSKKDRLIAIMENIIENGKFKP